MHTTVEIPLTRAMRVSEDVALIAKEVGEAKGFDNARSVIEAIVRCHWRDYLNSSPSLPISEAAMPTLASPSSDLQSEISAASAFDSALNA